MTPCTGCTLPLIYGACPDCDAAGFVAALFALDVTPGQFISPAHYGAWMRRKPIRHTKEKRSGVPRKWREGVLRADHNACIHCGAEWGLTFGHVVPWIFGGSNQPCNGRAECQRCNGRQWVPALAEMVETATCRRDGTHPTWATTLSWVEDVDVDSVWNPVCD